MMHKEQHWSAILLIAILLAHVDAQGQETASPTQNEAADATSQAPPPSD